MKKTDIKSLSLSELKEYLISIGEQGYRAAQVYQWMHQKLAVSFDEMSNLSKRLREKLKESCILTAVKTVEQRESKTDGTRKFLYELWDGNVIECVMMKYHHGISVCISSQVGCRMGCRFCASAIGGLTRNLTVSEMLEQVYEVSRSVGERVSNIVIMGTGEPFDNYDNLVKFIRMISDESGLHISQRSITVSTCGLPEKIRDFAGEGFNVTLALSLHAPNEEDRKKLMPVAAQHGLPEVLDAFDYYYEKTGRRLTYEYSLIKGVNDSEAHAYDLFRLLKGKNAHVNLIPVNQVKERDFIRSEDSSIAIFKNILEKNRINVTIRREMGTDIDAACGQLRKSYKDRAEQGGEL